MFVHRLTFRSCCYCFVLSCLMLSFSLSLKMKTHGKKYSGPIIIFLASFDHVVLRLPSFNHFWFYLSWLGVWNAWDVHINVVREPAKKNLRSSQKVRNWLWIGYKTRLALTKPFIFDRSSQVEIFGTVANLSRWKVQGGQLIKVQGGQSINEVTSRQAPGCQFCPGHPPDN